jgi:hypothetical protein
MAVFGVSLKASDADSSAAFAVYVKQSSKRVHDFLELVQIPGVEVQAIRVVRSTCP